ncbi:hypothetical protein CPB83DRAFT_778497, partial [Crepidotus variabilis]
HQIPNSLFGSFGMRHSIRIFFPRLAVKERESVELTAEEVGYFYNKALRPATLQVYPNIIHDLPGTWDISRFKDRRQRGGFSNSGVLLRGNKLGEFSRSMRAIVNANPDLRWAQDFFFGFEIRGLKQVTKHGMRDQGASEAALAHLLEYFVQPDDTMYVDVGVEIGVDEKALAWVADGHGRVVAEALGIEVADANRLVGKSCFYNDMTSCLEALAGFRTALLNVGEDLAVYLQAYLSDKTQTYHLEGDHGINYQALTFAMALLGNPPIFCKNLLQVLQDATLLLDVLLRIEVRVPLWRAHLALQRIRRTVLVANVVMLPRKIWW